MGKGENAKAPALNATPHATSFFEALGTGTDAVDQGTRMKPIPVRSVETLRRLADDIGRQPGVTAQRNHILRAISACFGFPSWEALSASISPSAPEWIRDQDLSDKELSERRAEQSRHVAKVLEIPFATSADVVLALQPTRDFARPIKPIYVNDQGLLRAQRDYQDEWWVCSTSLLHPLAPTGWHIGELMNLSDRASAMIQEDSDDGGIRLPDFSRTRHIQILVPPTWPTNAWSGFARHHVMRFDDALRIKPVAWSFVFDKMKIPKRFDTDFRYFPYANRAEALRLAPADLDHHSQLVSWAKAARIRSTEGRQFPARVRQLHGQSAFWPLIPVIDNHAQAKAWREAGTSALQQD